MNGKLSHDLEKTAKKYVTVRKEDGLKGALMISQQLKVR